jgi:hypothetical protein
VAAFLCPLWQRSSVLCGSLPLSSVAAFLCPLWQLSSVLCGGLLPYKKKENEKLKKFTSTFAIVLNLFELVFAVPVSSCKLQEYISA